MKTSLPINSFDLSNNCVRNPAISSEQADSFARTAIETTADLQSAYDKYVLACISAHVRTTSGSFLSRWNDGMHTVSGKQLKGGSNPPTPTPKTPKA